MEARKTLADLRSRRAGGRDGRRRALGRIVAGLVGVEFDELWRRDAARRRRTLTLAAAISVAGAGAVHVVAGQRDMADPPRSCLRRLRSAWPRTVILSARCAWHGAKSWNRARFEW